MTKLLDTMKEVSGDSLPSIDHVKRIKLLWERKINPYGVTHITASEILKVTGKF